MALSKSLHGSLVALALLTLMSRAGEVLTVGPGGDWGTIGQAVAAAGAGDTIEVASGSFHESVVLDKPVTLSGANHGVSAGIHAGSRIAETTLEGGILVLAGAEGSTISGFRIEQGFDDDGSRSGVRIEAADVTLRDTIVADVGTFPVVSPGSRGIVIVSGSTVVSNNRISGNGIGMVLDGIGRISISGNRIEGHDVAGVRITGESSDVVFKENGLVENNLAIANEAVKIVDASHNYWNSGRLPPLEDGDNGIQGAIAISPWYADASLQTLVSGVFEDETLGAGENSLVELLHVAPGVTYTVNQGRLTVGQLDLQENAVLEVIDGDLVLDVPGGGDHTIAGSFRITHSLGSIEILADTTFSGNTLGLASDFHIGDGVVLSIIGSLRLDGCRLSSDGSFTVVANVGSSLEMTRCDVFGGAFFLVGSDVRIVDNAFSDSMLTVFGTVTGAEIYHNVLSGGAGDLQVLPGASVLTSVEGWGNVASAADAKNRLALKWQAPGLPGRTLDVDGNLFVQPGDAVRVDLDSGAYTARVQAAEMLLAYHSGYLSLQGFSPLSPWENELYLFDQPSSLLGKVDAAAGFGFNYENSDGTLQDHVIGDFEFLSGQEEGRTMVFFREKDESANPLIDTRLTTSEEGVPGYLDFPFTRNSGTLIIDGTLPLIEESTVSAVQNQGLGPVDVFQSGVFTRMGAVGIGFDAFDALAGINPATVSIVLDGPVELGAVLLGSGPVDLNGESYTHFEFEALVDAATPDGLYDVIASVTDFSGNSRELVLGTIEVAIRNALVEVECQGMTSAALTRAVEFSITDGGGSVLEIRTGNVEFVGGSGSVQLTALPAATSWISAKTAWTLRRRLPCVFDSAGDAQVSFVGASHLRGGDLNGNNVVNLLDYSVLNANWFTTHAVADISGDGVVNVFDYNLLNSNWYTAGDPP